MKCTRVVATAASLLLLQAATTTSSTAAPHVRVWEPAFGPALPVTSNKHVTIPLAGAVSAPSLFGLFGHVTLGSPPQDFRVLFQTDEDAVWVPNFRATPTSHHAVYDHNKSRSYEPDGAGAIGGGMGYVYIGYRSRDTLRLGGATLVNASFVEATQVPTPRNWDDVGIDGMVGLSPRLGENTVLAQLTRAGVLADSVFAFYLPRARSRQRPSDVSSAGELSIGAVDTRRFTGDVQYVDTEVHQGVSAKWIVALDAVTVNGARTDSAANKSVASLTEMTTTTVAASSVAAIQALLDASLPLIIGPKDDIARLAKAVGADGMAIDCDAPGPDIAIHIGGTAYVLTKNDYTLRDGDGAGDSETCRWAFAGMNSPGLWILGQPFLQAVYTVFDFGAAPPRVGFAQAPAA